MAFYKFSKSGSLEGAILFRGYFSISLSLALELESSLISFAGWDSTSALFVIQGVNF